MADIPIRPTRRGGTIAELRASAYVAPNTAGYQQEKNDSSYDTVENARLKRGTMNHNPAQNTAPSTSEIINFNFQPNVLDAFDVYTYHWKLFITSLENSATGNVLTPENQILIAESGVSDLTIDNVSMDGIAVPSVEAGTGTQTKVKFEIVEPSGAGLYDKLFYQALALGIGNWVVMPLYLQLEFRARDPATSNVPADGAPSVLSGKRWVWPIKIGTAKAHVSHVGTRYEFDAIMYDEIAQSNAYFSIQHNVVLKNLTTFDNAMTDLVDKLNADQFEKLIDDYSIPDSYEIIVDPEISKFGALVFPTDDKSSKRSGDFIDIKKKTATFNQGTSVDKIIDTLLCNTVFYKPGMQNANTPSSPPNTAKTATEQMKKFWRIVTETRPIAYDPLRQDNAVAIKIFVIHYPIGVLDATPMQTAQTPDSKDVEIKRMAEYVKRRILRKRYDYIFTGLNDQIKDFDLTMNHAFAAAMSRFGGIYSNSATQTTGLTADKDAENEKNAAEQIRKVLNTINDGKDSRTIDAKIAEAKAAIAKSNIIPALKERYTFLLDHARPKDRLAVLHNARTYGGISSTGDITEAQKKLYEDAKRNAKFLGQPVGDKNLQFISDVQLNSPATKQAVEYAKTIGGGKLRPIPYRETNQDNNIVGMTPTTDASNARVSSIFSTALYSGLDASLTKIKITIKGDPFWLFPAPLSPEQTGIPRLSIESIKRTNLYAPENTGDDVDSANFFGSDNFIVIRFRTPRIYNETSDTIDPYTEVETFSGVYKVIEVVSKFTMGVFSQELSCIIDPVINLTNFLTQIEESAKKIQTIDVNRKDIFTVSQSAGTSVTPETLHLYVPRR